MRVGIPSLQGGEEVNEPVPGLHRRYLTAVRVLAERSQLRVLGWEAQEVGAPGGWPDDDLVVTVTVVTGDGQFGERQVAARIVTGWHRTGGGMPQAGLRHTPDQITLATTDAGGHGLTVFRWDSTSERWDQGARALGDAAGRVTARIRNEVAMLAVGAVGQQALA